MEAQDLDGLVPECESGEGCPIPPPHPAVSRALEIRDKLVRLSRLNIGDAVLRLYLATREDLEFLALIEDELNPEEDNHGDGCEVDTEC